MVMGLTALLSTQSDMSVVATAANGKETLARVIEHHPDVLLLDVDMPLRDGYGVLRELKEQGIACRAVLYATRVNPRRLLEAIQLGVCGVVLKEMAPALLLQCLRKVHAGGQWLEKQAVAHVLEGMLERDMARHLAREQLTPREVEMIRAVSQGLRNKVIAQHLKIKEGTVRIHLSNIYEKLDLDGRTSLTLYARETGLS